MSSPYLNNLIIIGCILTYTSVILLGLNSGLTSESNFPYICAVRINSSFQVAPWRLSLSPFIFTRRSLHCIRSTPDRHSLLFPT